MSDESKNISEQVNTLVNSMVEVSVGKWEIPEESQKDVDPAVLYAAKAEKRVRETQGNYTKTRQEIKKLESVNNSLSEQLLNVVSPNLDESKKAELDELKNTDPEKWRTELNRLEVEAKKAKEQLIKELEVKGEEASVEELKRLAYEQFESKTGIQLTDDILTNKLPSGYLASLKSGVWDFNKFLNETETFLTSAKVVAGSKDEPKNPLDLGTQPGGTEPTKDAAEADILESYKTELY